MKPSGRNLERFPHDFSKLRRMDPVQPRPFLLGKIVSGTAIDSPTFLYEYEIEEAILDETDKSVDTKTDVITQIGYSISELGNASGNYAYGVPSGDLPAGFTPKKIPDGTPVFCVGMRMNDGTFFYLIINTQAISGEC